MEEKLKEQNKSLIRIEIDFLQKSTSSNIISPWALWNIGSLKILIIYYVAD